MTTSVYRYPMRLTRIDGEVILRLAVLGFRTHLETIELALEILQQKAKAIEAGK